MRNITHKKDKFSKPQKRASKKTEQKKVKAIIKVTDHELNMHEIELHRQNAELLKTQEKLNAAVMEYSELFEFSPVGYFILDKNGLIENVNVCGTVLLGLDKKHLIHKPFSRFLYTKHDRENFYRHIMRAIEEGTQERMECEIKRKDGVVFSPLIKSKAINNEKLQFKHLLSIMTDISQIKQHEHQVELQLTRSEEMSSMKSRFIGMASHEFRTPLSSVLTSTSLIEQYAQLGETDKMKKHLMRIKSSIKNLVAILDEFLSIEKLESGKVELQSLNFDLPGLCGELVDEVAAVKKKGQVIRYQHNGNKEITTDKKALQHIVLNLLSNGCKYSPEEKEIKLITDVTDHEVKITVQDFGIGIPKHEQANVFTRFFRAHNTANIQGTGLGLNIVKMYVELLNGTIGFVSNYNIGTVFTVTFPQI
jgi:PAS domain S-box-containing protein